MSPIRLIDPCCGPGDPLAAISRHLEGLAYGIELDQLRAAAAEKQLAEVLQTDALRARISPGAFSLLFLNPPYDSDGLRRLEHRFLVQATPWLAPKGLLIYIIPQNQYRPATLRYIASWFEEIRLYRFPGESFRRFKQAVLFGVKRKRAVQDFPQLKDLGARIENTLPDLPETSEFSYSIPPGPKEILFRQAEVTPEEAIPEISTYGAWCHPELPEGINFQSELADVRPLLPLRQGHIAQLVAAGFVNNRILEKEGERFLIKGRTIKELRIVDSDSPETMIQRDVILTTITAIDEKGNLYEIGETDRPSTSLDRNTSPDMMDEDDSFPEESPIEEENSPLPARKTPASATRRRITLEE
jgi:hypothetical protein